MPEVNLLERDELPIIEINVAPSSSPINYRGEYHYRSGSTKQQLKGAALNDFLLRKTGARWDSITIDNLSVDNLDFESIRIFRQNAIRCKRMAEEDAQISNQDLLESLQLISNGKLTRAAALLFYRNPEKICPGCYVKIGKFIDECELEFQDILSGSLFSIADKIIDLLYLKYLKTDITYEHDKRIERYPYPRPAVRESIFNALIHCNWSDNIPIQIRVDENALYISNSCILPLGWTQETLLQHHRSQPFNPLIANAFFRAGYIESWGRGIQRILKDCRNNGYPAPVFTYLGNEICVQFSAGSTASIKQANQPNQQASTTRLESSLEEQILEELRKNPDLNIDKLANILTSSRSTIYRAIRKLTIAGRLSRIGSKKNGSWNLSGI